MKPRHVLAFARRSFDTRDDFIKRHWRRVDSLRARRAMRQQCSRHERSGVEANGRARDQVATAHRDEVGGAGTRSDEMNRHLKLSADRAAATVTLPMIR